MTRQTLGEFMAALDGRLRFDCGQLAFCTHYSWFGIVPGQNLGIGELYFFYNRRPGLLSPNLLTITAAGPNTETFQAETRLAAPLRIEESGGAIRGEIAFLETDIACYHARLAPAFGADQVRAELFLVETDPRLQRTIRFDKAACLLVFETRVPKTDPRDPDDDHQLTLCLLVPPAFEPDKLVLDGEGVSLDRLASGVETKGDVLIGFAAARQAFTNGEQSFAVGIGEGPTAGEIESRVRALKRVDSEASRSASEKWLADGLADFSLHGVPDALRTHYAKAAYQILSNTKAPRGRIAHRACYPSRGTYCAHYLWDACFTNVGVVQFNLELAKEFLLVLCENQEPDGKIPQFVCATWVRPGESQPPLIAWSAWSIYELCRDVEFVRKVYGPLARMADWWFANRDSDSDGVVEWNHRLEAGWDDSPRFERGRIAAVDLNSYLNREMRILAEMAGILGLGDERTAWQQRASEHASRMNTRLFDQEDGIFYDHLVNEDRPLRLLTPACFMPLWAGTQIPPRLAQEMIARYLVNPRHFFGSRPFPVVAYSEPTYNPERWWRGPVWPNIAWAMTEILRLHGFTNQHREAVRRLVDMMVAADELNELYSSATGEPLGSPGLCWGDAAFMALARAAEL